MKIKLTVPLASANGSFNVGDEYECNEAEAKRFIAAGYAVEITKKVERATKPKKKVETRAAFQKVKAAFGGAK